MSESFTVARRFSLQRLCSKSCSLAVIYTILCTLVLPTASNAATDHAQRSSKRGLIDITTLSTAVQDDALLTGKDSDISWYYNYKSEQTSSLSSSPLNYVPMLWGLPGTGFYNEVTAQLAAGADITTVLGFNEPDGCDSGGSCIAATEAATLWKSQIEPLKTNHNLKLGSPAPTGSPRGIQWLADWFTACDGGCNPDFITIHFYGDFEGLASFIGQINATYLHKVDDGIWITEFGYADQDLTDSQAYYNETVEYLDRLDYIQRYAYFGSFRSSVSNVGPDAAMLNGAGLLTDIGSWYLGGAATGVIPSEDLESVGVVLVAPGLLMGLMMLGLLVALRMI